MRTLPILLILAASALGSCDTLFCDDCGQEYVSLFEDDFAAQASPDRAVYDRPITLRASVTPRFTGTGAFVFDYFPTRETLEVLAPTAQTLSGANNRAVHRVAFQAGVPTVVEWRVHLGPQNGYVGGYRFPMSVGADSVEVGGVLRPVDAPQVQEAYLGDGNLVPTATLVPSLTLR